MQRVNNSKAFEIEEEEEEEEEASLDLLKRSDEKKVIFLEWPYNRESANTV